MKSTSNLTLLQLNKAKPEIKVSHELFGGSIGVVLFLIINTPSIKLLLGPSELVNMAFFGLLLMVSFFRLMSRNFIIVVSKDGMFLLGGVLSIFLLTIFPEGIMLRDPAPHFVDEMVRFIYLIAVTGLVIITVTEKDVYAYLRLQFMWGVLVALLFALGYIHYQEGQHYNTVSLPIALSLLCLVTPFLHSGTKKMPIWNWLATIIFLLIEISALAVLPSRSPAIGIPISVLLVLFLSILGRDLFIKSLTVTIRIIIFLFVLSSLIYVTVHVLNISVSQVLRDRLMRLFVSFQDEPRLPIIITTLTYILENPIGYGLGSFPEVTGWNYPHNLFLDAAFSGGWLAAAGMMILISFLLWRISRRYRVTGEPNTFKVLLITVYLLLTFMSSYSWTDAYLLFAALGLGLYQTTSEVKYE